MNLFQYFIRNSFLYFVGTLIFAELEISLERTQLTFKFIVERVLSLAEPLDATLLIHFLPDLLLFLLLLQFFSLCFIQGIQHLLIVFIGLSIQYTIIVVIKLTVVDNCEIMQNGCP